MFAYKNTKKIPKYTDIQTHTHTYTRLHSPTPTPVFSHLDNRLKRFSHSCPQPCGQHEVIRELPVGQCGADGQIEQCL